MIQAERKRLRIRDEVHGDMVFDRLMAQVIDHEHFQRLRYIRQLGLAEYIFPCANQTRFQHSLGAAYLAGHYFKGFTERWLLSPIQYETPCEGTLLFPEKTFEVIRAVVDTPSEYFWYRIVCLAGLLHDIGHGPWSHTFEHLAFRQDFSAQIAPMTGVLKKYFTDRIESVSQLSHEDLSLIYVFDLFKDLEKSSLQDQDVDLYILAISGLIHRKLVQGEMGEVFENELSHLLEEADVLGGVEFHKLLRPLISGPFDVDRMDYIQRDGKNCGVPIGGIEWRRIISQLIPCLAEHTGKNEPSEVVLISNIKNQHVLDDFIFSLFQMYTQVYLHPKIVGLEEVVKQALEPKCQQLSEFVVNFDVHRSLTDERLREVFVRDFGIGAIEKILKRHKVLQFEIVSFPPRSAMEDELVQNGFRRVSGMDRPMMKDSVGVFLYSQFKSQAKDRTQVHLFPWFAVSPIAGQFFGVNYSPNFWIR